MIVGIGTDICQVSRIEDLMQKNCEKFVKRVLTITEQEQKQKITAQFIAKRYSAKEACAKALGCGIGEKLSFQDIEVSNLASGQPTIAVKKYPKTRLTGKIIKE